MYSCVLVDSVSDKFLFDIFEKLKIMHELYKKKPNTLYMYSDLTQLHPKRHSTKNNDNADNSFYVQTYA